MSDYSVISEASKALKATLWAEFQADPDPQVANIVGNEAGISLLDPHRTGQDSSLRLSLWLYRITENEHLKNQPMHAAAGLGKVPFTPLALNLFFLVTPFATSAESDLLLLGRTMQVFHDRAVIPLRQARPPIAEELRIVLGQLTLDELTRVWEALSEPYRLSVCYQVRVTRVDSRREIDATRVAE